MTTIFKATTRFKHGSMRTRETYFISRQKRHTAVFYYRKDRNLPWYVCYGIYVHCMHTQYKDAVEHGDKSAFRNYRWHALFIKGKKLLRIQCAIKRIDYNNILWDNKIFNGFFKQFICIFYIHIYIYKQQFSIT